MSLLDSLTDEQLDKLYDLIHQREFNPEHVDCALMSATKH